MTSGYLYDPATNKIRRIHTPAEVFCGGVDHPQRRSDADRRGHGGEEVPVGLKDVWLFNPATLKWTKQPNTPLGRYYPTIAELPMGVCSSWPAPR